MTEKLNTGLLKGCAQIIDETLNISPHGSSAPGFHTETGFQTLLKRMDTLTETMAEQLLDRLYRQIEKNFRNGRKGKTFSGKNWELRKALVHAVDNKSLEKTLEKAVAEHGGDCWFNQMPTSSGFIIPSSDRHRNIDLVWKTWDYGYNFFELKLNRKSGHPLYALLEVISYGLLYLLARVDPELQARYGQKEIMKAGHIGLRVLAADQYYPDYSKAKAERNGTLRLEAIFLAAIESFAKKKVPTLEMEFRFMSFHHDFCWSLENCRESKLKERIQKELPRLSMLRGGLIDMSFHETGHAVVGWLVGFNPDQLILSQEPGFHYFYPAANIAMSDKFIENSFEGKSAKALKRWLSESQVIGLLAGPIAQNIRLGGEFYDDDYRYTEVEYKDSGDSQMVDEELAKLAPRPQRASVFRKLEAEAIRMVRENWTTIEALAERLMQKTELSGEEIMSIFWQTEPPGGYKPREPQCELRMKSGEVCTGLWTSARRRWGGGHPTGLTSPDWYAAPARQGASMPK